MVFTLSEENTFFQNAFRLPSVWTEEVGNVPCIDKEIGKDNQSDIIRCYTKFSFLVHLLFAEPIAESVKLSTSNCFPVCVGFNFMLCFNNNSELKRVSLNFGHSSEITTLLSKLQSWVRETPENILSNRVKFIKKRASACAEIKNKVRKLDLVRALNPLPPYCFPSRINEMKHTFRYCLAKKCLHIHSASSTWVQSTLKCHEQNRRKRNIQPICSIWKIFRAYCTVAV